MGIRLHANIGFAQRECNYRCPVTDQPITSHRQRAEVMARHDLVDANDFPPARTIERENRKKTQRDELAAGLSKPIFL